jgi:hypothetical protein
MAISSARAEETQSAGIQSSSPKASQTIEASGKGTFEIKGQPDPAEVMKMARAYNSQYDTKKNKIEKWMDKEVLKHPKFWRVMRTRVEPAVSITANIIAAVFSVASFVK